MGKLRNIHPGEVLKEEFLEPLHITPGRLAEVTGITDTTVANIIHGTDGVTVDSALRLAKFLGTTPRFWMGLQVDYDLEERQMATHDELDPTSSTTLRTRVGMIHHHKDLIKRITTVDERPEDPCAYAQWIKADAHLRLLRDNANHSELIIYATGQYTFVNTVAVDAAKVDENNLDVDDLLAWSADPFHSSLASYVYGGGRDDVWIERERSIDGAEALRRARPLIFGRVRPDRPTGGTAYFEASQEYSTLSDIHFYPEHSAYCRYDDRGDLEHVITITAQQESDGVSLVTFEWEQLEQYLAASRSVLVRMFDFTLYTPGAFQGWSNGPENVITDRDIFYRQKIDGKSAAYTRGVQIILPRRPKQAIFDAMKGRHRSDDHESRYVSYDAYDFRNKRVTTISTNPIDTANNFSPDGDDRPHELSPAFFNAEVLARFKANTDKYVVESRRIHCRDAWTLQRYDINAAGQVHAYICDLRNLPYAEQIYWKGFNERPKASISERAIKNDFLGQWIDLTDPLERIKRLLAEWNRSKLAWWNLREKAAAERVTLPVTDSRDEWANAFKNLSILVIEGFSERSIRARLKEEQIEFDAKEDKSIVLIEKLLSAKTSGIATQKLEGLRLAQRVRSKVDAHARGAEAEEMVVNAISDFGSLTEHFRSTCEQIVLELETIEQSLGHEGLAKE